MKARHSRQARLVEVGEEGQRKIGAMACEVRGRGVASRVEARYLAGAGVARIVVEDEGVACAAKEVDGGVEVRVDPSDRDLDRDRDPEWANDLHPAAREIALGAHRALVVIRSAVLPLAGSRDS